METLKYEKIPTTLMQFAKVAYGSHDAAHNFSHAQNVHRNAIEIVKREGIILTEIECSEFPYITIGHDFDDHKLAAKGLCFKPEVLYEFYARELGNSSANKIRHIHANCSWSKRKDSIPLIEGDWIRKVLQDADWLEAIGEVGLQRCIEFTKFHKPDANIEAEVCKHIKEKLLNIPMEFNFESTRRMVVDKKLTAPLTEYLLINDK